MAEKINAVIIDDETPSIETLCWKLENYCPEVSVMAYFDKPEEGVAYLKSNSPDILFLDIEMPRLNGFEVLEELGVEVDFDVIFTTAYDSFGVRAIKFSALDYLLKPIQNKELKEAIQKHQQHAGSLMRGMQMKELASNVRAERGGKAGRIALPSKENIEFVDPADIVMCVASSNYTEVYLNDGARRVISKTLKEFEELLVPFNFYRPHQSYLINLSCVKEFRRGEGGFLIMENKFQVPVSKNKKEELFLRLT